MKLYHCPRCGRRLVATPTITPAMRMLPEEYWWEREVRYDLPAHKAPCGGLCLPGLISWAGPGAPHLHTPGRCPVCIDGMTWDEFDAGSAALEEASGVSGTGVVGGCCPRLFELFED